jgi:hypothetical protein
MREQITSVQVKHYPVLEVRFADGLSGEFDVGPDIAKLEMFAPLKDEAFFRQVSREENGWRIGWRLDDLGNEIDYGSDTIRNEIERNKVIELALAYRAKKHAAE